MSDSRNVVNSHIQMPKLLLKRFHNNFNRFFYYDVEKRHIGKNGSAGTINTQRGYYSKSTEDYLRDEIETPFGNIIAYIERMGILQEETIEIKKSIDSEIKKFVYALISRGATLEQNGEMEEWLQLLPERKQHDYISINGINIAGQKGLLDEYIVTFMMNKTDIPFVLSMDGVYNYSFNGHLAFNLPISPQMAICLIHINYFERMISKDGTIAMFEIERAEDIMCMNQCAFNAQVKCKWGYIICSQKQELERLAGEINV